MTTATNIEVRDLRADDAPACDGVIASLPTFFGDPQGIRDDAEAVRSQRGFVATVAGQGASAASTPRARRSPGSRTSAATNCGRETMFDIDDGRARSR